LSFGGCNYLGLAQDPRVVDATRTALEQFGLSSSASRETTGNTDPHEALERRLGAFTGYPASLLLPDGYTANLAALQALEAQGFTHALIDERAHRSLVDAARVARMATLRYAHRDPDHAARTIARTPGRVALLTDGVFTADGAIAPLHALLDALRDSDTLLVDDCHGFGVLGPSGRGTPHHTRTERDPRVLVTTTLSKGLGCAGGVVLGAEETLASARANASAYICTTPASPALAAGAIAALGILETDPSLPARLRENAQHLRSVLAAHAPEIHADPTPIRAFTPADPDTMHALELSLLDEGIVAPLIRYPGGPASLYFRLSVSAAHTREDIDRFDEILTRLVPRAVGEPLRS